MKKNTDLIKKAVDVAKNHEHSDSIVTGLIGYLILSVFYMVVMRSELDIGLFEVGSLMAVSAAFGFAYNKADVSGFFARNSVIDKFLGKKKQAKEVANEAASKQEASNSTDQNG